MHSSPNRLCKRGLQPSRNEVTYRQPDQRRLSPKSDNFMLQLVLLENTDQMVASHPVLRNLISDIIVTTSTPACRPSARIFLLMAMNSISSQFSSSQESSSLTPRQSLMRCGLPAYVLTWVSQATIVGVNSSSSQILPVGLASQY